MYRFIKQFFSTLLTYLISIQLCFGFEVWDNDFCLVSEVDDRKIVISNGKENNEFTFFSSTNKFGKTNQTYFRKEMLECFSVKTPTSLFPIQYIESLDEYWEGSVNDIKFFTVYCLINDFYENDITNSYQHFKRTDFQIVHYLPNSGEESEDNINLSVRSIDGVCNLSNVGKSNELNDDLWGCYWNERLVWVDKVCERDDWKLVYRRRNI